MTSLAMDEARLSRAAALVALAHGDRALAVFWAHRWLGMLAKLNAESTCDDE